MNGSWKNWAVHAAIGLALTNGAGILTGSLWIGAALTAVYFYAKETGEQSVRHDWRIRSWKTDANPFDPLWTTDDRLDLLSGALPGFLLAALVTLIG